MKARTLPCIATLVKWNADDGVGVLRSEAGEDVKCGRATLKGLRTSVEVGSRFRVESVSDLPIIGLRATRVADLAETTAAGSCEDEDTDDDDDDDDDEKIPTDSLAHAIAWLEQKSLVKRPTTGATKASIAAFEERMGVKLAADYKRFLETYGYLDGRVHVFGIVKGEPAHDIETMRNHLREHIDTSLAPLDGTEPYAAEWRANAAKMRKLTPIMALGNPLLYAPGILVDAKGRYYCVDVRGFVNEDSFDPEPKGTTFEALLLAELAEWYADD